MEIHGDHAVSACCRKQVSHQPCTNRGTGYHLFVLPGIAVVWNDCCDSLRGRALERIYHQQQFHQMVIYGGACGLKNKNVLASHGFIYDNLNFTITKRLYFGVPQTNTDITANSLS